jgi:subtilisin-like proprotein convertase family protein
MKVLSLLCCCALMLAVTAQAGIIYSPSNPVNANITDGSAVGWSGTATLSGYRPFITDVTVNLNISGGYNGDLYAYLTYGGKLVPLLNRVGVQSGDAFGYGDTGLSITLSSSGAYNDVHFYGNFTGPGDFNGNGQLTGTWAPDGRNIDPQSPPGSFTPGDTRVNFGAYDGMNPNGTWTLFIADLSAGAQSQLVSWSLDVTDSSVPEPVNVALVVFASVLGLGGLLRKIRAKASAK